LGIGGADTSDSRGRWGGRAERRRGTVVVLVEKGLKVELDVVLFAVSHDRLKGWFEAIHW